MYLLINIIQKIFRESIIETYSIKAEVIFIKYIYFTNLLFPKSIAIVLDNFTKKLIFNKQIKYMIAHVIFSKKWLIFIHLDFDIFY